MCSRLASIGMLRLQHLLLSCSKFHYDTRRSRRGRRYSAAPRRESTILSVTVPVVIVPLNTPGLSFHTVNLPTPHTHARARAHLQRLHSNTRVNGQRYRYSGALAPLAGSLCSTSVRTTGYPGPPKPHNPHLHINLLFNIILCHSRPICHSPSRLPPS